MERYLSLDIGDKRIGVAVSDPFNSYALPVETYHRKNLRLDLAKMGEYIKEKSVTHIVCGLPVNFDGTPSAQTQRAEFFINKLKETFNLPVIAVDERCTTCVAEERLISQGKSREERKSVVDSLASAEILQGYLNDKNRIKSKQEKENNNMCDNEKKTCGCNDERCEHDHECDCGCNEGEECTCGCDEFDEDIVELTTEDGKKLKFFFIGTIEYQGKNYSAFEPAEDIEGCSEDDLIIFELAGDDEETADLLPIEDEALLDAVFNEFCRVLEEDELADEAESLEK